MIVEATAPIITVLDAIAVLNLGRSGLWPTVSGGSAVGIYHGLNLVWQNAFSPCKVDIDYGNRGACMLQRKGGESHWEKKLSHTPSKSGGDNRTACIACHGLAMDLRCLSTLRRKLVSTCRAVTL